MFGISNSVDHAFSLVIVLCLDTPHAPIACVACKCQGPSSRPKLGQTHVNGSFGISEEPESATDPQISDDLLFEKLGNGSMHEHT